MGVHGGSSKWWLVGLAVNRSDDTVHHPSDLGTVGHRLKEEVPDGNWEVGGLQAVEDYGDEASVLLDPVGSRNCPPPP
jgi:hypothetical protein